MTPPDTKTFRALARARLDPEPTPDAVSGLRSSDFALNGGLPSDLPAPRPAAVLAPIVARPEGLTVLLTLRATALRSHSGQVAFPGGKIDPGETALAGALREAREEIGLEERFIEPLGWLDTYLTGTGFRIAPLVDEANHEIHEREWSGRKRRYYAMPYEDRYIWGATAGMLRNLWERLFR